MLDYKNAIEQIFDVNIECNRTTNEYFIANSEDIKQDLIRSWLLNGFAISQTINESKQLKNRILFEQIPSGANYLQPIVDAMKNNKVLRISYQRFDDDDSYEVELEPYALKVFKQRWYVIGKTNKIKIYALDRIEYLEELQSSFVLPTDFDAEKYFADFYGIINDETIKTEIVCLRFHIGQAQYVRSLPLHKTQQETAKTNTTVDFEYYLKPTYDFVQEVFRYGDFVEVIKPIWLRVDFKDKIEKMNLQYKK